MALPQAMAFNHWSVGIKAMINLGFIGDGIELQLGPEDIFILSPWQVRSRERAGAGIRARLGSRPSFRQGEGEAQG